ncbi:hypothetical protein C3L33_00420, partial [Rhododendron williamsianum]
AYDDEEAAAHAYDLAALKYWGHDTILNFPLSTYQEELQEMEGQSKEEYIGSLRRYIYTLIDQSIIKSSGFSRGVSKYRGVASDEGGLSFLHHQQQSCGSGTTEATLLPPRPANGGGGDASSALGFLLQSPKFEELLDTKSSVDSPSPPPESDHPRSSFPDDIQTYFDCQDSSSYVEEDDIIFGDLNSFASPMFQCELDA